VLVGVNSASRDKKFAILLLAEIIETKVTNI
jgi:hypothetical protein